ncbi:MAG: DUF2254 domain-containing protein [Betaproteobacteria bacterium]
MAFLISGDRLRFYSNRLRERLWIKPLVICFLSAGAAFVAHLADDTGLGKLVPDIAVESIETLLSVMAASMLVIATFAVASMVSAYASASSSATPRAFTLVLADDVSQSALSRFIGAFIFAIVALTAVKNAYFGTAGLFTLFVLTAMVFGIVIFTFVRWVDRIARLGRLGSTIDRVEQATAAAMKRRLAAPRLHGAPPGPPAGRGQAVYASSIGYVQHVDMATLQACAESAHGRVEVAALPGVFAAPGRALAYVNDGAGEADRIDRDRVAAAFRIGGDRLFEDDPRFGLVVLSEIAGRALSPAVNDPGTAIDIIGTLVRLFAQWHGEPESEKPKEPVEPRYDRVEVAEISLDDMFDDAFRSIARDGAGMVEVVVRLEKAFDSLATLGDAQMRATAQRHARLAFKRAEAGLAMAEDLAMAREAAAFALETDLSVVGEEKSIPH